MDKRTVITGAAVVLLMGAAAAVASYTTRASLQPDIAEVSSAPVAGNQHKTNNQQVAAAQPDCNDSNIVGTVGGGLAGGLVGSQIGHGSGKTVATIGGVAAGALLGNQYIPTRNVTCRH